MVQIQAFVEIDSPFDKVWNIVADLDSEPKFWKGTKSVKNISKEGNIVQREITIAFRDSKCMQTITTYPKEKIHAQFTQGIIDGTKTITLVSQNNKVKLEAIWDIKLSG